MEVKQETIEQRFEGIKNGVFYPEIKGLDNLVFVKLSGKERNKAARVYSKALRELHAEGGLYSESLLPEVLKNLCREQGIDIASVDKARQIYERAYKGLPAELRNINKLSEEEVLALSEEEQKKVMQEVEEKTKALTGYWENAFSKEDGVILNESKRVEELSQQLRLNTYEHFARKEQTKYEVFLSARKADQDEAYYFINEDAIEELEPQIQTVLYKKYLGFRNGAEKNFLSQ